MTEVISLTEKRSLLRQYLDAEKAILRGQEYTIKDRSLTRADLRWVQQERRRLEQEIGNIEGGGAIKIKRVLFRDD